MAEFTAFDFSSGTPGKPYRVRHWISQGQSQAVFQTEGQPSTPIHQNYELADGTPLRCTENGVAETLDGTLRLKSKKFVAG